MKYMNKKNNKSINMTNNIIIKILNNLCWIFLNQFNKKYNQINQIIKIIRDKIKSKNMVRN